MYSVYTLKDGVQFATMEASPRTHLLKWYPRTPDKRLSKYLHPFSDGDMRTWSVLENYGKFWKLQGVTGKIKISLYQDLEFFLGILYTFKISCLIICNLVLNNYKWISALRFWKTQKKISKAQNCDSSRWKYLFTKCDRSWT